MTSALRVLILTPTALPSITGNALTVERWRKSLTAQGVVASVLPTQRLHLPALKEALRDCAPDLIHIHHAFRAGARLLDPEIETATRDIPLVVSPGGTDLHVDWLMESRRAVIAHLCRKARFIVTQSENLSELISRILPQVQERVVMVPKSFLWLGDAVFDLRKAAGCASGAILFFLPAGIRPVKGNLECLLKMEAVFVERPHVRIIFAGHPLDNDYSKKFEKEIARLSRFATWIPPIPPAAIRSAYRASDVVVNASSSEGLSNALLEAMASGRAMLASNIPGNRWPILGKDGDSAVGVLYDVDDPEDFSKKALLLIDDEDLRKRFGEVGAARAALLPKPEEEAAQLIQVYRQAVARNW